ncbi:GEN1, partial [Cervus elaphus hippelaphus]
FVAPAFSSQCLDMLECLGIPWVQAAGEAEAMCAYLNASGYVDGCLTNDGDAFLYGAQTVYRNFTMNTKDHEHNGCKLCQTDRYCDPHDYEYCCPCEWHRTEHERQLNVVEYNIKKKACSCEGFPFHEVTQEFLLNKDKLVKAVRYQRPDLLLFQRFTLEKMEWPNHYACEKLLTLLTHYDMTERKLGRKNSNQLQPIRIVKNRIRNGVHCFEIEWEKPGMKIKSKGNILPESDEMMNVQSHMTLKPTWEIFPKQKSKLGLEISPDSTSPEEFISTSLNVLLLPEDAACLTTQEQLISSPRPLAMQQIKDISKSLTAESSQPSTSSHNISAVADLHLSTIDWEGTSFSTSFSNSPAIPRNTFTHGLKSELETAIPDSFKNNPEQLCCESERHTTSVNKLSCWDLQKTNPEEDLLSGISDLRLQDLPLKERILIKSYPQNTVEPDVDLKTLSLLTVKEQCFANNTSHCPSHLSKDLVGIHWQNESRNCKIPKGGQLFQETNKSNTSVPLSVNNPGTKTSKVRTGPPNAALYHSRKAGVQIAQKTVMKKSVCLDRPSSDEESVPEFGKAKSTTQKMKQSSQKHSPTLFKKNDAKLSNPKAYIKETQQCVQAYETAGNEEACFPDESLSFLRYHKDKDDSGTCLDSPLPLSQRLKLRFQNTLNLKYSAMT